VDASRGGGSSSYRAAGPSPFFVGVIVVAPVGNAAEHWVYFALHSKIDLSINFSVRSAAQGSRSR
jgi:Ca2+:H+ antiporter